MMRIINDPKLDFSDVLLIPKRSTLGSRSEVDITRTIKMPYSDFEFTGVPIIAANMDTIGTMAMATSLYHHNVATAIHKHYEPEELINFFSSPVPNISLLFYSLGVVDKDVEKFKYVDSCIEGGIT
ncbi:MAG: GMP reductase, partial [Nitrosopumilaceae archaeon]|nr:GMP reductase [Nitrosopumilaceae archaeon]NIU87918.1 GMP reductase [Nitrosopumilaceae archaeon]NIX62093.1 GMP reductase [Nitrosopumilaceae archaeon]